MTRITSAYQENYEAPRIVKQWEKQANDAPTDEAAHAQLTYHALLQLRAIKVLLVWVLVVVPILAAVGMLVLSVALEPEPRF